MPNGTFTGCLGRIVYKESDLVAVGFFIKDYLSEELEFSVGIYSDELCCVTKKALRIPQYLLPTICFHPLVWLLFCMITLLSAFLWIILRNLAINKSRDCSLTRNYRLEENNSLSCYQFLVDSIMIMLSSPMRKLPKHTSERAFVASMCLVSLIFVSIFQSSLSTAFIRPVYYKDIDNMEDLAVSSLKIGIKYAAMLDDIFPPGSTGMLGVLREKLVLTNSTSSLMEAIAKEGKLVAMTRKQLIEQSYSKYFASRQVHLVPQCPRSYNLGFFGPKHSIFMDRINEVLLNLNNGGFHEKWIRDLHYNYTWIALKEHGSFHEDSFKVLTVEDLLLPYLILAIGCCLAVAVFIIERLCKSVNIR